MMKIILNFIKKVQVILVIIRGEIENNSENDKISIMSQPNINLGNANINIEKINEIIAQKQKFPIK